MWIGNNCRQSVCLQTLPDCIYIFKNCSFCFVFSRRKPQRSGCRDWSRGLCLSMMLQLMGNYRFKRYEHVWPLASSLFVTQINSTIIKKISAPRMLIGNKNGLKIFFYLEQRSFLNFFFLCVIVKKKSNGSLDKLDLEVKQI